MMRCSNCNRDYLENLRFCHQCGEPLHEGGLPVEPPAPRGEPNPALQQERAVARRRSPTRSSSLLFAVLVPLAAGVGLALAWYQWWTPPIVNVSVKQPAANPPQPKAPLPAGSAENMAPGKEGPAAATTEPRSPVRKATARSEPPAFDASRPGARARRRDNR